MPLSCAQRSNPCSCEVRVTPMYYNGSQVGDDKVRWSLKWWPHQLEAGHCGALIAIGLNPSTASAEAGRVTLDPTLRRLEALRRREGLACVVMLNVWPIRATDPAGLGAWLSDNRHDHAHVTLQGETVWAHAVCNDPPRVWLPCWGAWQPSGTLARYRHRQAIAAATESLRRLRSVGTDRVVCLGRTSTGQPRHPLYTRADAPLEPWP